MIKAIECRYAGRKFRSRREARWAVLFDHLDLDWVYESEGYVLDDDTCYLPDFELRLPSKTRIWVEVKPELENYEPLSLLVKGSNRSGCLVAEPMTRCDVLLCSAPTGNFQQTPLKYWLTTTTGKSNLEIQAASNAALSARWEHGETPRRPRRPGGRSPRSYTRSETLLNEQQATFGGW